MESESNLPGDIIEAIGVASALGIAQQPATLANLMMGNLAQSANQAQENAVSLQQSQNGVQVSAIGSVIKMLTTVGPVQAMSAQQLLSGNAMAEELAALKAAVAEPVASPRRSAPAASPGKGPTPRNPRTGGTGRTPNDPITGGNVYVRPITSDVNVIVEPTGLPSR